MLFTRHVVVYAGVLEVADRSREETLVLGLVFGGREGSDISLKLIEQNPGQTRLILVFVQQMGREEIGHM